jgi:hypothetical protein
MSASVVASTSDTEPDPTSSIEHRFGRLKARSSPSRDIILQTLYVKCAQPPLQPPNQCNFGSLATATQISIRFPRVVRIRDDKDFHSHTNLQEVVALAKASPAGLSLSRSPKGSASPKEPASPRAKRDTARKVAEAIATTTTTTTATVATIATGATNTISYSQAHEPTTYDKEYADKLKTFVGDITELGAGDGWASKVCLVCTHTHTHTHTTLLLLLTCHRWLYRFYCIAQMIRVNGASVVCLAPSPTKYVATRRCVSSSTGD